VEAAGRRIGQLSPALHSLGADGGPTSVANGLVDVTSDDNSFAGMRGFSALVGIRHVDGAGHRERQPVRAQAGSRRRRLTR
jgi:hypothetical protein